MLVLSRKRLERLVVIVPADAKPGDKIVVSVVDIRGDKVRLGVEARREYDVHRSEVLAAIERERVIDPLGVADAYLEEALINHG